ncbi:hypothetical protein [Glycomyces buryatensis]|uniref:Uncharacterized protein n=1 Tax=Glycomyces buryatensis TaxID=2570927 RepID=A0A4S8QGS0_9ACTN|nr:hypothetical protein [Glycomyces buryatensis]THV40579.1 hypothetical protein FAB82_15040 [Glycomyces buryatensis]
MSTVYQRALLALEDAGLPTGTIGPAHAGLPGLGERSGSKLVEQLLELDEDQAETLAAAVSEHAGGEGR